MQSDARSTVLLHIIVLFLSMRSAVEKEQTTACQLAPSAIVAVPLSAFLHVRKQRLSFSSVFSCDVRYLALYVPSFVAWFALKVRSSTFPLLML